MRIRQRDGQSYRDESSSSHDTTCFASRLAWNLKRLWRIDRVLHGVLQHVWCSGRSSGHGRQKGCARSGSRTAFVARKLSNEWFFGITWVTDVLTVFTFAIWNVFTYSVSNFRKIFVAEGYSTNTFFAPFSYEHFIFQIYSPSLKCRRVLFDSVDTILFAVSVTTNEISLLFIFKVGCAKCPRLTRKRFQDIHNQPDAQKHTVITFLFKLYISQQFMQSKLLAVKSYNKIKPF